MSTEVYVSYALCIRVAGRMHRVARKGSQAAMAAACVRENVGWAHPPYCVLPLGAHRVGDYIRGKT
jgi:hypothetical protein